MLSLFLGLKHNGMGLLKGYLSSCLGALTAMILFFVLVIILISSLTGEEKVVINNNSVLHLQLDAEFNELQKEDPFEDLFPGGTEKIGLLQLQQAISHAKNDSKIKGIYLEIAYPMTYYSTLEEIRQSLLDFRKSGKWVIAYTETMTEGAYYVASAADKVYLNPEGDVEFNGLSAQFVSFKKLLDKLEINPQVFRVGEFKSAVEPFLLEKMSAENRLQLEEMIQSVHRIMLERISESRSIPVERLKEISDNMLVRNADDAVTLQLIDSLLYNDQFNEVLRQKTGLEDKDKLSLVKYKKYRKSVTHGASKNEIAVIVAEGTIMPGKANQSQPMVGAETFVEEIRKARENDRVKAIVLRVNSPGGEYRSSDMIWREITLAAKVKPVIASMGDFAASGGYYIAMACDTIVALPNTITGSIGIFGVLFDMSNFFDHKLGITFQEVKTGEYGEMYTVTRPLTDAEKNYWQTNLDEYYEKFLEKAGNGRNTSAEEIRKVAGGRVWTGEQALERKLVDLMGGFGDAVRIAAEKANVEDDYRIRYYPKPMTFVEMWLKQAQENARVRTLKNELGEHYLLYKQWNGVRDFQGAQARMPFEFKLQ